MTNDTDSLRRDSATRRRNGRVSKPARRLPREARGAAATPAEQGFPIVAIGASAGGLEAATELLRALPPDTGVAVVLVQHLDPAHDSLLDEILARTTTMPVQTIRNGTPVRSGTVFVIPPNHGLELTDGRFRLTARHSDHGRPMPVDQFFRSVGETCGNQAIGVVLSGTGSDGALGLQAIKAEGGIAIAQMPDSAKFPDMPRAATSEGPVDYILPPGDIGRQIAVVARRLRARVPGVAEGAATPRDRNRAEDLRRIFAILRAETGVDFSLYRETTVRRRIGRRLVLNHIGSVEEYATSLRKNRKEVRALYDDLLITVTGFFRDPASYDVIATKVFPAIIRQKDPETPIRIWVPGCATGEEVYSLAIVLFEVLQSNPSPPPVQIFGTDISDTAIERARTGVYSENALTNVSPERLRAFFRKTEGRHQISKRIRDVCVFARQNVGSDPPFSNLDLLSCRNLLIYLEPSLQRRVIPLFHYALNPTGYLVLGSAETLGLFSELFEPVDRGHRIFVKKPGPFRLPDFASTRGPRAALTPEEIPEAPGAVARGRVPIDVGREADRIVLGRFAPPGVVVDEKLNIIQFRGRTSAYLEPAPGAASLNLEIMARNGLGIELRRLVEKARRTERRVRKTGVALSADGGAVDRVDLEAVPIGAGDRGPFFCLVLFESPGKAEKPRRGKAAGARKTSPADQRVRRLEGQLATTKEYLQSIIEEQEASNEELKSANEEILSSNEELQSTNEELETAKEELQSTNEEMRTVNDELQNRNLELADLSNDLVNLIASINIPIVMIGAQGEIRRFTPLAEKLLNLRATDVGRPIYEVRPNLSGSDLTEVARAVIETVSVEEREVQDTEGRWYLLRGRPYRTLDNRIDGAVLLFLDIDPMKRSLEQVSRARFYAETLVETVRDSVVVLDPDLRLMTANQSFYAAFQTTPLQTSGKILFELEEWQWAEPLRAPLRGVIERDERLVDLEVVAESRKIGRRTLLVNARQIEVPGEIRRAVLVGLADVSHSKDAEAKLRASESRYRQIFESALEGIWILEEVTGRILDANPFLVQLLGYPLETLLGRTPWELPLYEDPDEARRSFEELREKGLVFEPQVRMKAHDGRTLLVEEVRTVYQAGRVRLVQSNLRDVTDRQRLEDELREIQKMDSIGRTARGLAHDFNNILNIVAAYTGLLEREIEAEKRKEALAGITKAVQRGSAVVRQLLTFARRHETSFSAVDVNEVVREFAAMVSETFPRRISVELDLGSDLPRIWADANHLHQVLLNLCVNSRDAIADRGRITLSTSAVTLDELRARFPEAAAPIYVRVAVADTGSGMDEQTRARIFEPFFTTKGKTDGSGLGLPVVYGILKAHSGLIDVATEPGQGTTVTLYLPVRDSGKGSGGKREGRSRRVGSSKPEQSGQKVLVVEDERMLLDSTCSLLEADGYRVLAAADGEAAVETFEREGGDLDLVLLDLELPRVSGREVFRRIRQTRPAVRVLITSGQVNAAEKGFPGASVLHKPFTADDLLTRIRKALGDPPPGRREAAAQPASSSS